MVAATTTGMDLRLMVRGIDDGAELPGGRRLDGVGLRRRPARHRARRSTQLLADEGVNVVDLTTHVIGEEDRPVYAMLVDVTIPDSTDSTAVIDRLHALAGELGVSCSAHPVEPDILLSTTTRLDRRDAPRRPPPGGRAHPGVEAGRRHRRRRPPVGGRPGRHHAGITGLRGTGRAPDRRRPASLLGRRHRSPQGSFLSPGSSSCSIPRSWRPMGPSPAGKVS